MEKYHYPVYNPNISYQLNKMKLSELSGPPLVLPSGGMIYTTWEPKGQRYVNNDADAGAYFSDTDPLTYSIVRQPQGFSVSIVSGSLVHLSGNPIWSSDSFTVRATDPSGLYADVTAVLNFAPESLSSHNVVTYNPNSGTFVSGAINLWGTFRDANGDELKYSVAEAPSVSSGMTASLSGSMLYLGGTPTAPTTFRVKATDTHGASAEESFRLNFVPEALSQPAVSLSGVLTQVDLRNYFIDADQDELTFHYGWTYPWSRTLSATISGTLLLLSGMAQEPTYVIVRATDGHGTYVSNTVSVLQTGGVPQVLPSGGMVFTTWDPAGQRFVNNDADAGMYFSDTDPLTYSIVRQPQGFSASIVSGSLVHLSGNPTRTDDSFTVRATDPSGLYADLTEVLNFAPESMSSHNLVTYDPNSGAFVTGAINLGSVFYDANGDWLSYSMVQAPSLSSGMTAGLSGGMLYLGGTPTAPATFRVKATDAHGASTEGSFGLNFAPKALSQPAVSLSGVLTQVDLRNYFNDADQDELTFHYGWTYPWSSTLSATISGTLLLLSGMAQEPTYVIVRATDGHGTYVSNTVSVLQTSGVPQVLPSGGMVFTTWDPAGQRFVNNDMDAGAYFSDTDPLTYSIVRQPQGFSASIVSGSLVHLSGNPTRTDDSFTVRATDPSGLYADVTEVLNFAPQSLSSHNLVTYDPNSGAFVTSAINLGSIFYDANWDELKYSMVQAPSVSSGLTVSLNGSMLYLGGTPMSSTTFRVKASDTHEASGEESFSLNFAPKALSQPAVSLSGTLTQVDLRNYFSDADHDELTFSYGWKYPWSSTLSASISGTMLLLSGMAQEPVYVIVQATDGHGTNVSNTVSVQQTGGIPQVLPSGGIVYTTWDPAGQRFVNNDADAGMYFSDTDPLTYSIVRQPQGFSASIVSGSLVHLSGNPTRTDDSFTVRATDPSGLYADLTEVLNFAPQSWSSHNLVTFDPNSGAFVTGAINLGSVFYDANGDWLSYSMVQAPSLSSGMTAGLSGGMLYLGGTPTAPATFRVKATDAHGASTEGSFGLNFAPKALSQPAVSLSGVLTQVDLRNYFNDADQDELTFHYGWTYPWSSTLSASISGTLLLLSGMAQEPTYVIVRATDGHGTYANNTVSVQPTGGIPQVLPSGGLMYTTWDPAGSRFVNNDMDAGAYFSNTDPLTYSIVRQPQGFSASIVSGSLVHLSGNPTRTDDSFTVRATDPSGLYADLTEVLNFAPKSWSSHNLVTYDPNSGAFASSAIQLGNIFYDANGDGLSYAITEAPSAGSGMSASIANNMLYLGGTPTAPATFRVKATDTHGASAEESFSLNFAPKALSQPAVSLSGVLTQVDLRNYFKDTDHDELTFYYGWKYPWSSTLSASISGTMLLLSGMAQEPGYVIVHATDGHGTYVSNTVSIGSSSQNIAPQALSQPAVSLTGGLTQIDLRNYFIDANQDVLTYVYGSTYPWSNTLSASISGTLLLLSGTAQETTQIVIHATDGYSGYVANTVTINAQH
ncbi:hypothetical protein QJ48_10215 [Paenibacillus sp. A3]|nr:hypothetical protein QJ48_10215 [Paenibacillus sp. A3]